MARSEVQVCRLEAIVEAIILVTANSCHVIAIHLEIVCRRLNLQIHDIQMSCKDLTVMCIKMYLESGGSQSFKFQWSPFVAGPGGWKDKGIIFDLR